MLYPMPVLRWYASDMPMDSRQRPHPDRFGEGFQSTKSVNDSGVGSHAPSLKTESQRRKLHQPDQPGKSKRLDAAPAPTGRPKRSIADRQMIREVGTRLRWVREAYMVTQHDMAREMGLDPSAWSLYERGLRFPDICEAPKIAAKLQITVDFMLTGNLTGVGKLLASRLVELHPELEAIQPDIEPIPRRKRRA